MILVERHDGAGPEPRTHEEQESENRGVVDDALGDATVADVEGGRDQVQHDDQGQRHERETSVLHREQDEVHERNQCPGDEPEHVLPIRCTHAVHTAPDLLAQVVGVCRGHDARDDSDGLCADDGGEVESCTEHQEQEDEEDRQVHLLVSTRGRFHPDCKQYEVGDQRCEVDPEALLGDPSRVVREETEYFLHVVLLFVVHHHAECAEERNRHDDAVQLHVGAGAERAKPARDTGLTTVLFRECGEGGTTLRRTIRIVCRSTIRYPDRLTSELDSAELELDSESSEDCLACHFGSPLEVVSASELVVVFLECRHRALEFGACRRLFVETKRLQVRTHFGLVDVGEVVQEDDPGIVFLVGTGLTDVTESVSEEVVDVASNTGKHFVVEGLEEPSELESLVLRRHADDAPIECILRTLVRLKCAAQEDADGVGATCESANQSVPDALACGVHCFSCSMCCGFSEKSAEQVCKAIGKDGPKKIRSK